MKFEIKDEYIKKGDVGKLSMIVLPSGIIKVNIAATGKPVKSGLKSRCQIFNEPKIPTLYFKVTGWGLPLGLCGDAIITLNEMGYDLTSKEEITKIKNQDKEKIVKKYEILLIDKPDLFDSSRINIKDFEETVTRLE